uniref:NERD domain-containing protein n=1 Tax=Spiroplasma citri TaxID=2133 RepID=Q14KJ0_SPICI|nr:hypothetical protein with pd337008 domain [Spiroplasma citri]
MLHFDNVHLSYSYFNEETKWKIFQINHLLVKNNFIFVIETKNWNIPSYFDINKNIWYQYHGDKKIKLQSPIEQKKSHIYTLKKMLEKDKINLDNIFIINIIVQNNLTILKNENNKLSDNNVVINLTELENEIFKYSKKSSFFEDNKNINIIVMSILIRNILKNSK